ncbi:MAG TPA: peptidylprolyl isomerase [Thermoanaerobaculia bacterium]|nr:peptidylprolyl isomerase [Thermoanaerobaculia bacterium]
MKLTSFAVSIILAAGVAAQEAAAPKTAAVVNGEIITAEKLDTLYNNLSPQMRNQYEQSGGKKAFLDNYVAKRLLIQEALKRGFDERPEVKATVEAAKESALFDRYIRDVVASEVVPDAAVREFYEKNIDDFIVGDKVKVRHIVIATNSRTPAEAEEIAKKVFAELQGHRNETMALGESGRLVFRSRFAEAAKKYSEDGSAPDGGALGWVTRGRLDPKFEEVAFGIPAGVMSGIVQTQFGYHLILVDEVQPAGAQPFEEVRRDIREYLLGQKSADIMTAVSRLTTELRRSSKVSIYEENVD